MWFVDAGTEEEQHWKKIFESMRNKYTYNRQRPKFGAYRGGRGGHGGRGGFKRSNTGEWLLSPSGSSPSRVCHVWHT